MKSKKLFLPIIILVAAVLAIAVYSVVSSIAFKPTTTESDFPFSITYELDGKTITIDEVYKVRYVRNDEDENDKSRVYVGEIANSGKDGMNYILKTDENTRVELCTYFYPDYLMGDPQNDYFDEEPFEPRIYYYDSEENEYHDEETLAKQGVKLISFEYPTPIENSFIFSHISYFNCEIVLPTLLISLLALIAIIIFVRKEKELKYKVIDIVSILLNFAIGFTLLPFVTILALFVDVGGGGPELYYQVTYFIPAVVTFCIAASVALRRKGHAVKSLIAELIGPAVFMVYLIVFCVSGLF